MESRSLLVREFDNLDSGRPSTVQSSLTWVFPCVTTTIFAHFYSHFLSFLKLAHTRKFLVLQNVNGSKFNFGVSCHLSYGYMCNSCMQELHM